MRKWKTIWNRYSVSSTGSVYDIKYKTMLKPHLTNKGYWEYYLYYKGEARKVTAHRLCYSVHGGSIPKGMVINHIDHNKKNNSIANLECITQSENVKKWHQHKEKQL